MSKGLSASLLLLSLLGGAQRADANTCQQIFAELAANQRPSSRADQSSAGHAASVKAVDSTVARLSENKPFMNALALAVRDFKALDESEGEHINAEQAVAGFIEGLKGLKDLALANRFVKLFSESDRATRLYIFAEAIELVRLDALNVRVFLKGKSGQNASSSGHSLESLIRKPLAQLQEEAYFEHKSPFTLKRPQLTDVEATKKAALRYIARRDYGLSNDDVEYASYLLTQYPAADQEIDATLLKLLENGSTLPTYLMEFEGIAYAMLELRLLERNAWGLSAVNIDFHYSARILSTKTDYSMLLGELMAFHANFNMSQSPALLKIVVSYFRNHPKSFEDVPSTQRANMRKFKQDFGF